MADDLVQRLEAAKCLVTTLKQDVGTLQESLKDIDGMLTKMLKKYQDNPADAGGGGGT